MASPTALCAALVSLLASFLLACGTTSAPRTSGGVDQRTVVLVSLDGFRWDQLDFPEARNLRQLWQQGVRAEGLIPVFPSKTFPNHYSIVTGLYPSHHGIVSNNIRDPELGVFKLSYRAAVEDPRWWSGEPIWVTAELAGLRTAAMFWPGTETAIKTPSRPTGVRPQDWFRFDGRKPFQERTDQVLEWLAREPEERPRFITLYFNEPDSTSHRYGPDSPQAHRAVQEVDEQIGALVRGIAGLDLEDHVDLIITSDHGMAEISGQRLIAIEQLVQFQEGELFESGAFVQIFPNPGRHQLILDALTGAHPELDVFARDQAPEHYRVRGSERLAPILAVPSPGWEVVTELRRTALSEDFVGGHHGPDPRDPRLHGIFVAHGSSFKRGGSLPRVENVHIYALLCKLLDLPPAPNDGDLRVFSPALASEPGGAQPPGPNPTR